MTSDARHNEVSEYRDLGAPLLLIEGERGFDLWRVGSEEARNERIAESLSVDNMARYFRDRPETLRPMRLNEAKTTARIHEPKQLNLFSKFVDPNLLPLLENRVGEQLTATVVSGIQKLVSEFGLQEWIIKAVFRLLAGKILKDKRVPRFKSANLSQVEDLLDKVEHHYGSKDPLHIPERSISVLTAVMRTLQSLGDLRNLTTESLSDVYERALITPEIRKDHGTHKTPGYLVDYVVWQLARWIEEIPVEELRFFEPGCGHAPFLVSLMRLLRTFDSPPPDFSQFVRSRFTGVENDPFALEIARLSLTVADEPNQDGWAGLVQADMFAPAFLEQAAARSTVMLTNPPYERRKAEELLYRTLPHLPVGAVFGAIVPATLLFSNKPRAIELRSWMIKRCQLAEVDLFPDGLFTFGDHECALIAGRVLPEGIPANSYQTRLRRVPDSNAGRTAFKCDYQFGTSRLVPQSHFAENEDQSLWIAEFQENIWAYLKHLPQISTIATIGKGMEFKNQHGFLKKTKTIEDAPFPGSVEGFTSSSGNWGIHEHPTIQYFYLVDDVIGRRRSGTDCIPQILINSHPVSRGMWCVKPVLDEVGRAFLNSFLSVRPQQDLPLLYVWALLTSPLANLFVFTNTLKRDIFPRILLRFPIPKVTQADVARIVALARSYIELCTAGPREMFNHDGYGPQDVSRQLLRLDAEVLRIYRLPAKAERLLLEQFRGEQRPGVPIPFTEYYPADTPDVPLYAYISRAYQRALAGGDPELPAHDLARYEALSAKADAGNLTSREVGRLHELQAEIDGRDYWKRYSGKRSEAIVETVQLDEFDRRLFELSDRAASASIKRHKQ
ncbi:MAG: hypothetical protein KF844_09385 [Cryobacterium sp.]|nr:hypothetical protein [Cryobacterium sp.]